MGRVATGAATAPRVRCNDVPELATDHVPIAVLRDPGLPWAKRLEPRGNNQNKKGRTSLPDLVFKRLNLVPEIGFEPTTYALRMRGIGLTKPNEESPTSRIFAGV